MSLPADSGADAGLPACPIATEARCEGTCIDVSKDRMNCGGCGTKCLLGDCQGGQCLEKIVFVTSELFDGKMGGLAGADASCTRLAKAARLHGAYKAWLSDATMSAATRFKQSATLPYIRVDGKVVANSWGDLTDATLGAPIELNEKNEKVTSSAGTCANRKRVWTGTEPDGTHANSGTGDESCADWTSNGATTSAQVGDAARSQDLDWTGGCSADCDSKLPLYCFEQ